MTMSFILNQHSDRQRSRLERVVFRRDLPDKVVANQRDLGKDVFSYFRDLAEEEDGKDASRSAKSCCHNTAVHQSVTVGAAKRTMYVQSSSASKRDAVPIGRNLVAVQGQNCVHTLHLGCH